MSGAIGAAANPNGQTRAARPIPSLSRDESMFGYQVNYAELESGVYFHVAHSVRVRAVPLYHYFLLLFLAKGKQGRTNARGPAANRCVRVN